MADKVFTLKTYGAQLYKWSPTPTDTERHQNGSKKPFYCNATTGSQGEDWVVGYTYNLVVINGQQHRFAYVECGYVK